MPYRAWLSHGHLGFKILYEIWGKPFIDLPHSSQKLLNLIYSVYEANSKVPVAAPAVTPISLFNLVTLTYQ